MDGARLAGGSYRHYLFHLPADLDIPRRTIPARRTTGSAAQLSQDNIIIMIMMLFLLVVLPLSVLLPHRGHRHVAPYMGGRQTTPDMHFSGSLGIQRQMELSNYYLENIVR